MAESERSKVSLRSASEKRSRGSPTGCTPLQKGKRSTTELKEVGESQQTGSHHCQPRRRRLAFAKTDAWSDSEQIALVEFILLHKPGRRWPAEQDPRFWDSAAEYMYVAMRSKRLYNIITRYNYAKNAILSRDFANASCLLWSRPVYRPSRLFIARAISTCYILVLHDKQLAYGDTQKIKQQKSQVTSSHFRASVG